MHGKASLSKLLPYQQGKQVSEIKKQFNLTNIVKLSSNENPYGYSPELDKLTFDNFNIYPDGHASLLRTVMAEKLSVDEDQLIFGAGSDEIVQLLCRAFLYPKTNTVMATGTFPQYKHHATIEDAEVREVQTKEGYHDLDGMLEAIDENTRIIWLCSPDNPTGTLHSKRKLKEFIQHCPEHVLVVLDEAYYEFIDEEKQLDSLSLIDKHDNLIVLRTFSKAYGLAGLRIGYGIMHPDIAAKLNVVRGPFNANASAQKAAIAAINDQEFIKEIVKDNTQVRRSFELFLNKLGWHYYHSQTNFILVSTPISGTEVFQYLLENGFIVRPGELLGYPNTVRITIGKEEDMNKLKKLLTNLNEKINDK